MNHITKYIFAILSLIILAGCSGSEQGEEEAKGHAGSHLAHPLRAYGQDGKHPHRRPGRRQQRQGRLGPSDDYRCL